MASEEQKLEELRELVQAIRDRVRTRYPATSAKAGDDIVVPLADLLPVVHARDAAQGKAASIGAVNPRPGGVANQAIQFTKRTISRGLHWFVRDQVVFNQSVLTCVETLMEAVNELNRSLKSLGSQIGDRLHQNASDHQATLQALQDRANETARDAQALRAAVAPLPAKWDTHVRDTQLRIDRLAGQADQHALAGQARALQAETHEREILQAQHREFMHALNTGLSGVQKQLWGDMERVRMEFERTIHAELRTVRQRATMTPTASAPAIAPGEPSFDYPAFAARFRGSPEHVRASQQFYVPRFQLSREVIDLGCGNGEFLDVMREANIPARGVDSSPEAVAACHARQLSAERADLFEWLDRQPDYSIPSLFCSQVVEHLQPMAVPRLVQLCAAKLERGGLLAIETPNPDCLAIFATHFYLDPTHTRPVPRALLAFYLEEFGMGAIEAVERFPAADSWPELNALPEGFRHRFFGGLDYVVFARKL